MTTFTASQKLWRVGKEIDGYYYELRAKDTVIDRIKITPTAVANLKNLGVIHG